VTRGATPPTPAAAQTPILPAPQRSGGVAKPLAIGRLPSQLCPEALRASCCVCKSDEATDQNDLALCDRCDRAFHQYCHSPPVPWFGRPEDQWFCAPCAEELARSRELRLRPGDFAWAAVPADSPPWPARVLRIDFVSLTDSRPYWVQFFDSGPTVGAWVAEVQVTPWQRGPAFATIKDSRRRLAVRFAEADGASPWSHTGAAAPVKPMPSAEPRSVAVSQHRSRAYPARPGDTVRSTPAKRRRPARQEDGSGEDEDEALEHKVDEMRKLIVEARERQRRLERQLDEAAASQAGASQAGASQQLGEDVN